MATRHPVAPTTSLRHSVYSRPDPTRPEILVKLGPTTDGAAPFCWSSLGPTTADITIETPRVAPVAPAAPVDEPASGSADTSGEASKEDSGEHSGEASNKAPATALVAEKVSGVVTGGNLRSAAPKSDSAHRNTLAAAADPASAETDESDEPAAPAAPPAAPVEPVAAPVEAGPTPTAQPTFLQGPRVYVHMGHPECFDFAWETMPPPEKTKK